MKKRHLRIEDCINDVCPWSGNPVIPEALTEYRGRVVGFCNIGCRDKFEAAARDFDNRLGVRDEEEE